MSKIDEAFARALDTAVPETWTTLGPEQLDQLKQAFTKELLQLAVDECNKVVKAVPTDKEAIAAAFCATRIQTLMESTK
jgi:hypothetical protein